MSRATIIVIIVCGAISLCGTIAWLEISSRSSSAPKEAEVEVSPNEAGRHQQVEDFFGGDPNRDVRGGQKMKPRW